MSGGIAARTAVVVQIAQKRRDGAAPPGNRQSRLDNRSTRCQGDHRIRQYREKPWLLKHPGPYKNRKPDHEIQGDQAACAGAENRRRSEIERAYEFGGIVGLLADRCGGPAARAGTAGIAPAVVCHHREVAGEQVGRPRKIAGVPGRSGNQQQRRPVSLLLVIEMGSVRDHEARRLGAAHGAGISQSKSRTSVRGSVRASMPR